MKIVHIEDFFHPNAGYQINILPKYMVKRGIENYIITSKIDRVPGNLTSFFGRENIEEYDKEYEKMTGVRIIRISIKGFFSSRAVFGKELDQVIKGINPDILYVHGNDTLVGMNYIWKQKKLSCALISDSHMLEMASTNRFNKLYRRFYKMFITPHIVKNKITVIRTQDDDYVEKYLGIPINQAPWISYGSDTMLFHPDEIVKSNFREEHCISKNAFVIIYAGKLDESKGGLFLAEALKQKLKSDREIVFVIVGNTLGKYGKRVESIFECSENKILRFPTQRYTDLACFFQIADMIVFPKQCSLSFFDAQACGLPVLSEDNNINVERCSHKNGFTFKQNDMDDFRNKMQICIDMDKEEFKKIKDNACAYIKNGYDYADKADEYIAEIVKSLDRFRSRRNEKLF